MLPAWGVLNWEELPYLKPQHRRHKLQSSQDAKQRVTLGKRRARRNTQQTLRAARQSGDYVNASDSPEFDAKRALLGLLRDH